MKFIKIAFVAAICTPSVCGAGLFLAPVAFPKTFNDVPFVERVETLRDGYMPYRIEYDENGLCISGCAYHGVTIKEDMAAVDEATNEIAALIEEEPDDVSVQYYDWCHNGRSTKLPLRYPVDMSDFKYRLSSDFGFRSAEAKSPNGASFHPAIDISCPSGTPVYATADGVVEKVDNETTLGGAGNYVNIKHDNGLMTQYLHLKSVSVVAGQRVSACQQIALSGNSGKDKQGNAYAAHLDYRVRFDSERNKYVDILCPCKVATKSDKSSDNTLNMSCLHSLFNASYKFQKYDPNSNKTKRSLWRVEHGHCMKQNTDLLPDEVAP